MTHSSSWESALLDNEAAQEVGLVADLLLTKMR